MISETLSSNIFVAVFTVAFWFLIIYKKDIFEPEPLFLLFKIMFVGGLLSGFVIFILLKLVTFLNYSFLPVDQDWIPLIIFSFTKAVVAEFSKVFILLALLGKDDEFDEPIDGVIYATTIALGYGLVETLIRLNGESLELATLSNVFSIPGNLLYALIWGYGLSLVRFKSKGFLKRNIFSKIFLILPFLLVAIAVNSAFNLITMKSTGMVASSTVLIILVIGYLIGYKKIIYLRAYSLFKIKGQCNNCLRTNPPSATYCQYCGNNLKISMEDIYPKGQDHQFPPYKKCLSCGTENMFDAVYCGECGEKLSK